MRYGTRTHSRRRWSRQGRRPCCQLRLGYEWAYLYVALCPFTGDVFAMLLPHLDKAGFGVFLRELELHLREKGAGPVLLIGDGAAAHTAQPWEQYGLDWQRLPTACPELNPVERFFEELRKWTANQVFADLQQIEKLLESLVRGYMQQPEAVKQLTLFPYIAKCV
ncbi:hypothetical protein FVR03_20255 [Pontibacter qinzhouensis]|uniref:Tc1-like transposase DDE domain-containing protein n=1 Tax=Pontibacter qinzhouensis TaxID=2603253 RepID=A0A5C8J3K0_9BACT|nr:hypothetical protein FVR03_20255 [Pontibacter qinzhouensis]